MKYVSKQNPDVVVDAKEVKKDTTVDTPEYGTVLVTKGNYILTNVSDSPLKGSQFGITKSDLDLYYTPVK